ncbi:Mov34/MPN/PAD-1 family protein [Sulfurihydrogenibium sp.]|uniref:Mov34/MPN/PAD-1 family protein n=1 Tax=Sulfurihydrogenibium sp. TaxID=2053621 RepID=UPI003D1100CB
MLKIKKNLLEQIKKQSEEGYPYEICGFILGKIDYKNNVRQAVEVIQVENQNKERANDRFEISPKDYMKVEDYADKNNLQIVGIYHSHPDHPDRPSQTDLLYALEDLSYIIVSVEKGKAVSYKSWYLKDGEFEEEVVSDED